MISWRLGDRARRGYPMKPKHPPGPPMTLGKYARLEKGIAPDRAKRAEVGGHSGRKFLINKKFLFLINKKFLTGPASNLHIPNDSVALCLKQTFCDGYHYI
jgi:hypothetical protein